jgi:hypothetical protein
LAGFRDLKAIVEYERETNPESVAASRSTKVIPKSAVAKTRNLGAEVILELKRGVFQNYA